METASNSCNMRDLCSDCLDHGHSFDLISFHFGLYHQCAACGDNISGIVVRLPKGINDDDESMQVLKCNSCGLLAHRACVQALAQWKTKCSVNSKIREATESAGDCRCLRISNKTDSRQQCQVESCPSLLEESFQRNVSSSKMMIALKNQGDNPCADEHDYASYAKAGVAALAGGMGLVLAGPEAAVVAYHFLMYNPFRSTSSADVSLSCNTVTLNKGTTNIVLVRPGVQIDAAWDQIFQRGRSNAPMFWRKNKQLVDFDGGGTIPSEDQIMRLVSRALTNRLSLSGFMYRYLASAFHDRYLERQQLVFSSNPSTCSVRCTRDDAHAVVKYLVGALLEEYPELDCSFMLVIRAVRTIVLTQIHEPIYEEIRLVTKEQRLELDRKIATLIAQAGSLEVILDGKYSKVAVKYLQRLSTAHAVDEKLYNGVKFLDALSAYFAQEKIGSPSTEALLSLAFQHVVLAAYFQTDIHTEVKFLEEFASDEQLVKGREGYGLVTLQASLHYLSTIEDLLAGVFA